MREVTDQDSEKTLVFLQKAVEELKNATSTLRDTSGELPLAWLTLLVASMFDKSAEAVLRKYGSENVMLFVKHMHASGVDLKKPYG